MEKEARPLIIKSPSLRLSLTVYAHRVLTYRYHWHEDEYEVDIIISGRAVFSKAAESIELGEDEFVIIEPLKGHTSLALEPGTCALVLRLSASALESLRGREGLLSFTRDRICGEESRREDAAALRHLAAAIVLAASGKDGHEAVECRALAELFACSLLSSFGPVDAGSSLTPADKMTDALAIVSYLEENYMRKLSLGELADFSGYNRTYLSTFFKERTGLNFHDFLTRIRFKHAMEDLTYTDKSMLCVAMDNGFPDAKGFSSFFSQTFHMTPAQYRERVRRQEKSPSLTERILKDFSGEDVRRKLHSYTCHNLH